MKFIVIDKVRCLGSDNRRNVDIVSKHRLYDRFKARGIAVTDHLEIVGYVIVGLYRFREIIICESICPVLVLKRESAGICLVVILFIDQFNDRESCIRLHRDSIVTCFFIGIGIEFRDLLIGQELESGNLSVS